MAQKKNPAPRHIAIGRGGNTQLGEPLELTIGDDTVEMVPTDFFTALRMDPKTGQRVLDSQPLNQEAIGTIVVTIRPGFQGGGMTTPPQSKAVLLVLKINAAPSPNHARAAVCEKIMEAFNLSRPPSGCSILTDAEEGIPDPDAVHSRSGRQTNR